MPNYTYANDGRTHTRYSELKMCTLPDPKYPHRTGQLDRLVALMTGELDPFQTEDMIFGTERHELWAEESQQTGKLPLCFHELPGIAETHIDFIEQEYAVELAPGVVVHSRPDAVCAQSATIFDYKTVLDGTGGWQKAVQKYRQPSNRQATFYALMLKCHDIPISRVVYLCEVWDAGREHIRGYEQVVRELTDDDLHTVHEWALQRILLLKVAIQQSQEATAFRAAQ